MLGWTISDDKKGICHVISRFTRHPWPDIKGAWVRTPSRTPMGRAGNMLLVGRTGATCCRPHATTTKLEVGDRRSTTFFDVGSGKLGAELNNFP